MAPHQNKNRNSRPQPEAIVIRPVEGKNFAEVFGQIRAKASPTVSGAKIKLLGKTQSGKVWWSLISWNQEQSKFGYALLSTLGESASVR